MVSSTQFSRGLQHVDEIAVSCSTALDWTRSLLTAVAALGLSRCEEGRWQLTSEGRAACGDEVVRAFADYHLHCFEAWGVLPDRIRSSGNGPGFHWQRNTDPAFLKAYLRAMEVIARPSLPFLREHCPLSGRILDVGAGPSTYCRELAAHGEYAVTGLDLAPIVEAAKQLFDYPPNYTWIGSEFQNYKPSDAFDAVFCSHLLEYCPADQLPQWLQKLRGFVRPDGVTAFVVFLPTRDSNRIDLDLFELSTGVNGTQLGHVWGVDEFREVLVNTGASHVRCVPLPNGPSYSEYLVLAKWRREESTV